MPNELTCRICDKSFINLGRHLRYHDISSKEYYDTYIKKEKDGICLMCGSPTTYFNVNIGYGKHCSQSCAQNNPERIEISVRHRKKTMADNPEIMKRGQEKRLITYANNPEIMENRNKKLANTWKNNPELLKLRNDNISNAHITLHNKLYGQNSSTPYFLYIINHLTKPIVKIGISKNPQNRLGSIIHDFGESQIIHIIKSTYNKIDALESFLHEYFNEHRKVQPSGGGKTEWFDECILEEAKQLIQTTQPLIN